MNNKVLVIGGSGFVGSYLLNEISSNEILNYDKVPSPFFKI